ncbi:CRISPR system precrRNA processing endoribonuclease RAMP protein Cas6 [Candidatus Cloacimonadota bacterium]
MLKDTFCIQKRLDCSDCPMKSCLYRTIFESEQHGFENFKPYIIRHLKTLENTIIIEFTILGLHTEYSSSIIHAILKMQDFPLLIENQSYPLTILKIIDTAKNLVFSQSENTITVPRTMMVKFIPTGKEIVTLKFLTPLRMKHEGVLMRSFHWQAFYRGLYYRTQYLNREFNENSPALPELWEDNSEISANMQWQEMYRKSFRQSQKMSLGGLIGEVVIKNPDPQTVGLLRIGTVIQAGKQTTFGLGKYEIS